MQQVGSSALHASIAAIVPTGRRSRSMPRHLLHGGQVHAQVEQIPNPGSPQIVGSGGLHLSLEAALPADPPGTPGAEASQLIPLLQQPSGLEHRTEERARLGAANLQPVLEGGKRRRRQAELARFAALATTNS
jgi:hypothetical protein